MSSVVDLAQDSPFGITPAQQQRHQQAEVIDLSSNDSEEDVCRGDKTVQANGPGQSRKRTLWGEAPRGPGVPGASRPAGGDHLGAEGSKAHDQQEVQHQHIRLAPRRHLRIKLPSHMRSPAGQAPSLSGPSLVRANCMDPLQSANLVAPPQPLNPMAPPPLQQLGMSSDTGVNASIPETHIQGSNPFPSSTSAAPPSNHPSHIQGSTAAAVSQSNHPSHIQGSNAVAISQSNHPSNIQGLPDGPLQFPEPPSRYGVSAGHPSRCLPSSCEDQEQGACVTNDQQRTQGPGSAGLLLHHHHQQQQQQQRQQQSQHGMLQGMLPLPGMTQPFRLHQQQQQEQQQPHHGMLQGIMPLPEMTQPFHLQHEHQGRQQEQPYRPLSSSLRQRQSPEQQQQQQQQQQQEQQQQSHRIHGPARQRRRLNPPSLPSNPPVQPLRQGSHLRLDGGRLKQLLGREGRSNNAAEVYTLEGSSSSDDEVEVTACAGPPQQQPQAQRRRRTVQPAGRQRTNAAAAANTPSSHTSSFSGLDDDEKLALELQREEDSRLARELAQRLEEEEREERMRARWDAMEAIEEAESRRPPFAPPRGPGAPFRPPSFTSNPATPPPPSRSSRSRGPSFESHVFGPSRPPPSRSSRPQGTSAPSNGAFRGRSRRLGEGSSNGGLPPLPHALFGMMDSDTDDSRDGYEYERGRHGRGMPMLGRGRGGLGFGMGLFGGPFGGGMGGRGFGMPWRMAAGGRGSNLPPNLLFSDRDFTADDYEALCRLDESVENRTGATRSEINALPTEVVRKAKPQAGSAGKEGGGSVEALECAICIEEVQPGEVLRTTPCLHKFHKSCLDTWLAQKARCPVCQASCRV